MTREGGGSGEGREVPSGAQPKLGPKSPVRPQHLGIQAPNRRQCTNDPCVSACRQGGTLLHEISYNYLDAVSLGDQIRRGGISVRGGGMACSKGAAEGLLTPEPRRVKDD